MKKLTIALIVIFGLIIMPVWPANATFIKLEGNFFADPTVAFSDLGFTATLEEDPPFVSVILSNDPGWGDPEVIFAEIGGVSQILSFAFDFTEPAGNKDEFGAFVIDAATGLSAGFEYEYFKEDTTAGNVSFDLTALIGKTLGLQFQLLSLPGDSRSDSTLTVSNVTLAPVPEPATMILVGTGLFGLLGLRRKKFRNKG